jgi:hypothetical protein
MTTCVNNSIRLLKVLLHQFFQGVAKRFAFGLVRVPKICGRVSIGHAFQWMGASKFGAVVRRARCHCIADFLGLNQTITWMVSCNERTAITAPKPTPELGSNR